MSMSSSERSARLRTSTSRSERMTSVRAGMASLAAFPSSPSESAASQRTSRSGSLRALTRAGISTWAAPPAFPRASAAARRSSLSPSLRASSRIGIASFGRMPSLPEVLTALALHVGEAARVLPVGLLLALPHAVEEDGEELDGRSPRAFQEVGRISPHLHVSIVQADRDGVHHLLGRRPQHPQSAGRLQPHACARVRERLLQSGFRRPRLLAELPERAGHVAPDPGDLRPAAPRSVPAPSLRSRWTRRTCAALRRSSTIPLQELLLLLLSLLVVDFGPRRLARVRRRRKPGPRGRECAAFVYLLENSGEAYSNRLSTAFGARSPGSPRPAAC